MEVAADLEGSFALDNARVNGILTAPEDFWFLVAVLNSRTVDWVFRRIAKPKANGFFEANKQFIAPLPIPRAGPDDKAALGRLARRLTVLHTGRRRLEAALDRRVGVCRRETMPEHWLWPDLGDEEQWLTRVPPGTSRRDRAARARAARTAEVESRLETVGRLLRPDALLAADFRNGELRLLAGNRAVLDRIFLDAQEGARALLAWRIALRRLGASRPTAGRLVAELRRLLLPPSPEAGRQLAALQRRLAAADAVIAAREAGVEARLDVLYGLTAEERALISADKPFAA